MVFPGNEEERYSTWDEAVAGHKRMVKKYEKEMKDLTQKENWTPELIYVNKTRLIIGFIFGFLLGLYTRLFF